jgi:hypothetical protein
MAMKPRWMPDINEDLDAEFSYWKTQFVVSAWAAVGTAIAMALLIAAWPQGTRYSELHDFARQIWPLFVECAFWLGFLLGLLWGAAKRAGSMLSGTLPWKPRNQMSTRAATARQFGHWAIFTALAGSFLWISLQFPLPAEASTASFFSALALLMQTCLWSAAVFALIAIAGREHLVVGNRAAVIRTRSRHDD